MKRNAPLLALFRYVTAAVAGLFLAGSGFAAVPPGEAIAALDVGEGLEASLFASEPMLLSPSSIDIDHLGRIWVCEVINYRGNNGKRPEGDRILVLEDSNGDGKADKQTVFYQGRDIDSAHGVCVLGNKVIVSAGDNVWIMTDENGDLKSDKKEALFTKIGGAQHDHGIHAFSFGSDGKLYFNFGNASRQLADASGKIITDKAGNEVKADRKPYQQGMAFRCDLDGSNVETLGWNFRNNWEVCVDSFGTVWQSDNDDDGNRGVRINFVMEFGNYGYRDEFTGKGWGDQRTNMEKEIPLRHWHLNDPGVVPNLLQTGQGSPTGIITYEGSLLPSVFRNQVIHCDAGPNVARAYPVKSSGAGYKAEIVNILKGARDNWFRPSDVCVAPDGSLFVADWYDPGVGGHAMRDLERGRIFRVAVPGSKYSVPKVELSTPDGAAAALTSPNGATRYLAWTALHKMGDKAGSALQKLWKGDNPRHRARALWVLGKMAGKGPVSVDLALTDSDPDIRIVGIRLARQLGLNIPNTVAKVVKDKSAAVRREAAIALRFDGSAKANALWTELALQHDAADRWSLEALGIGSDLHATARFSAWLTKVGSGWKSDAGRDIVWRCRSKQAPEYLAKIIKDKSIKDHASPRYMRAFDFHDGEEKKKALESLLDL
jgi:putative membrane-bound dehydrogenase-like protein